MRVVGARRPAEVCQDGRVTTAGVQSGSGIQRRGHRVCCFSTDIFTGLLVSECLVVCCKHGACGLWIIGSFSLQCNGWRMDSLLCAYTCEQGCKWLQRNASHRHLRCSPQQSGSVHSIEGHVSRRNAALSELGDPPPRTHAGARETQQRQRACGSAYHCRRSTAGTVLEQLQKTCCGDGVGGAGQGGGGGVCPVSPRTRGG